MPENKPQPVADLHVHTTFSDGTFTPERIVKEARRKGLCCIAVTDHDEVAGIGPAQEKAERLGIEVLAGVELSTELDASEIHILGYCIDWQAAWFKNKLEKLCQAREDRALVILEKLNDLGIRIDPRQLLQDRQGSVGRLHIARLLHQGGFVSSIQEAFNRYLGNGRPCNVKKARLAPEEAVQIIEELNGIAVLAHPYCIGKDELIVECVRLGVKGIEAYYPDHTNTETEHYLALAKKYNLVVTGGSDCHGLGKGRAMLGAMRIPYALVENLKSEAENVRRIRKKK